MTNRPYNAAVRYIHEQRHYNQASRGRRRREILCLTSAVAAILMLALLIFKIAG